MLDLELRLSLPHPLLPNLDGSQANLDSLLLLDSGSEAARDELPDVLLEMDGPALALEAIFRLKIFEMSYEGSVGIFGFLPCDPRDRVEFGRGEGEGEALGTGDFEGGGEDGQA